MTAGFGLVGSMGLLSLARWQWQGYGLYHQTMRNLLVHIVAVPMFLLGNVLVAVGLVVGTWWVAAVGALLSGAAFAVQGVGHKGEPVPPVPFSGPGNAAARVFLEQWVTFPRFVLSGGWAENLRAA